MDKISNMTSTLWAADHQHYHSVQGSNMVVMEHILFGMFAGFIIGIFAREILILVRSCQQRLIQKTMGLKATAAAASVSPNVDSTAVNVDLSTRQRRSGPPKPRTPQSASVIIGLDDFYGPNKHK